jgi:hypothetical protein
MLRLPALAEPGCDQRHSSALAAFARRRSMRMSPRTTSEQTARDLHQLHAICLIFSGFVPAENG